MDYGSRNTAPEALKEKAKVRDDSFVMVQHLNEVSGMRCDSTAHGNNGLGKLDVQMNFNAYDLGRIVFNDAALWTEYQKISAQDVKFQNDEMRNIYG